MPAWRSRLNSDCGPLCMRERMPGAAEPSPPSFTVSGLVQSVVSGLRVDRCAPQVVQPTSISVAAGQVSVEGPFLTWPPCVLPIVPPQPYSVVAEVGMLPPGEYSLSWTQGDWFSSPARFVVPSAARSIPSTSTLSVLILALAAALLACLVPAAHRRLRQRR